MWDSVKKIGWFLFLIGCICTWVAFFAPRINPSWITDPYQLYLAGIFLVGTGIFLAILGWILGGVHWGHRRFYGMGVNTKNKRQRAVKWVVGCVVLVVIISVVVALGPALVEKIRQAVGGAPLYPNSEPKTMAGVEIEALSEILPPKWSGRLYETIGEENEIANWYRSKMLDLNWVKEYDNQIYLGLLGFGPTILGFTKGEDATVLVIRRDSYWLFTGPKARLSDMLNQATIPGLW